MKLNKLPCLKGNLAGFEILVQRLADLVGDPNALCTQDGQDVGRVFVDSLERQISMCRPRRIPHSVQGVAKICQNARIQAFPGQKQFMQTPKLSYGLSRRWATLSALATSNFTAAAWVMLNSIANADAKTEPQ
jgi:hypothetical protein